MAFSLCFSPMWALVSWSEWTILGWQTALCDHTDHICCLQPNNALTFLPRFSRLVYCCIGTVKFMLILFVFLTIKEEPKEKKDWNLPSNQSQHKKIKNFSNSIHATIVKRRWQKWIKWIITPTAYITLQTWRSCSSEL